MWARIWITIGIGVLVGAYTPRAYSANLPFDPGEYGDKLKLIVPEFVGAVVHAVGAAADHRPYNPASNPSDRLGFEIGVEATLVKLPDSFEKALTDAGIADTSSIPPSLPIPKLHIRQAFGPRFAIGLSGIGYRGYRIIGGDIKIVIVRPAPERLSAALRLCYSEARLGFLKTKTWSPQFVISKPLDFAEPYFGAGAQLISGRVTVHEEIMGHTLEYSAEGRSSQFLAFMGLQLRPAIGFQITVEGGYNPGGTPTLGTRFGLSF